MVQEKKKFLIRWKGYMAEENTQENRENLENMKELVEKFEREYGEEAKELRQQEQKKKKGIQLEITQGIYGKITIQIGKKKIQKRKRKEIGQELEQVKIFLRTRKLEGGTILREPQKGNNFLCI